MRAETVLGIRLTTQRIGGSDLGSPLEVVRHLLAMQGQDYPGVQWSIGLRSPGSSAADVRTAFSRGEIVRSWPLRGTLHAVAADDLGWLLSLTAPRTLASSVTRRRRLGLDDAVLSTAEELATAALTGGRALSRAAFLAELVRGGVEVTGQRGYHLIWHLAQRGLVCWGPLVDGSQQGLVLTEEWIRAPRLLERDEALREFVLRYLGGHGPAMLKDFVWWSGLTVAEAKTGWSLAGDEICAVEVDGAEYWMLRADAASAEGPTSDAAVFALPGFDEYLLGYRDRSLALPAEYAERIVPGGNGMFLRTIVAGGRVVGTWRRSQGARPVIEGEPFEPLSADAADGFLTAAARYTGFLGTAADILPLR